MPPWAPPLMNTLTAMNACIRLLQGGTGPAAAQGIAPLLEDISQNLAEMQNLLGPDLAKYNEKKLADEKAAAQKALDEAEAAEKKRIAEAEAADKRDQAAATASQPISGQSTQPRR